MIADLRVKLKYLNFDEFILDEIDEETHSIIKFFLSNKEQKECFEEIMSIREAIKQLENDIDKVKEEEQKKFKKRYEGIKNAHSKQSVTCDLISSALFGNGIVI